MSHLLYRDGEPDMLVEVRSSWVIERGHVRPLGTKMRQVGREGQRSRIRERILASGKTSLDALSETRRILRERIAQKAKP